MQQTENQMKAVTKFEIIDHGIDNAQYFQGCGVSFTSFDECATGCGENASEAYNDALESLAQNGWDVLPIVESEEGIAANGETADTVSQYIASIAEPSEEQDEDHELYYYVSIRVA